ncbi:MAG TPA: aminotransferase class IV, partial [Pyrinomonadaceae bacterium]|nr:aminotransferase class IV [Pyrinomonadaceae bacterium]
MSNLRPHAVVSLNGRLTNPSDAQIPALSSAGLVGRGVFTTIAIIDRKPFLWEKHWRRLGEGCNRTWIDLSAFSESKTRETLDAVVSANAFDNGRARITFFFEAAGEPWPYESERPVSLLIITGDARPKLQNPSLTVSPFRINSMSPLSGVKSCNYLDKILSIIEARRRRFDEAIQLNERGEVASACMANVFWLRDGVLFTPSLKSGCLAGTTREFVLENFECREVEIGLEELRLADEIFLTSAGLGIIQVA